MVKNVWNFIIPWVGDVVVGGETVLARFKGKKR